MSENLRALCRTVHVIVLESLNNFVDYPWKQRTAIVLFQEQLKEFKWTSKRGQAL